MAIAATAILECNASATANNVNGGWFNYANANFITDYTASSATGNAPVIASGTYSFVSGDANAWIYVQSGTNWTAGFYKITSVLAGAATINATIGAAVQLVGGVWIPSTAAGCATVASPSGGVVGIDYSRGTAAILADTDLACADGDVAGAVVTSALKPFGRQHAGNHMKVTAGSGYTVGWYEVVSVSGVSATLDRAVGTDGAKTGGTFYLGGALSLAGTGAGATEDAVFEAAEPGTTIWVKAGTYNWVTWTSVAKAGTAILPIKVIGYNATRGDDPNGDDRPYWNFGATGAHTPGNYWHHANIRKLGTAAAAAITLTGTGQKLHNCKIKTLCLTSTIGAINSGQTAIITNCEVINSRGIGIITQGANITNCYIHSCFVGIKQSASNPAFLLNNIISDCSSANLDFTDASSTANYIVGNTFSGFPTSLFGIGLRVTAGAATFVHTILVNNIFTGFATAISLGTENNTLLILANNFYNNTSDGTLFTKSLYNIALAPQFTSLAEVTGTNGTSTTSVLTSSGADFSSVVAGRDSVYVVSGSGVTAGFYGITLVSGTSLTLDVAIVANAVEDIVFKIVTGRDFRVGANMKAVGLRQSNSAIVGATYTDLGALQRIEPSASGSAKAGLGPYKF